MFAYIGSRTTRERNACGDGISICHINPSTGQIELIKMVKDLINPSFLTISNSKKYLYAVHGDMSYVSAFAIQSDGDLVFIDRLECGGKNPVHLAVDRYDRYLVISNHITGNVVSIELMEDGKFSRIQSNTYLKGKVGPHRVEQPFSKPHYNAFDISQRFVLIPDKGLDRIFCFNYVNGNLIPSQYPYVNSREGAGPRHYIQHPNQKYIYVVNELDSTVVTYEFRQIDGKLTPIQNISTLSTDYVGNSRAAAIEIDKKGNFLYASNRGENTIAIFKVDPRTGKLTLVKNCDVKGKTPRFIKLSPDNKFLYSLNEESHHISIFSVNAEVGSLRFIENENYFGSPVCIEFLEN